MLTFNVILRMLSSHEHSLFTVFSGLSPVVEAIVHHSLHCLDDVGGEADGLAGKNDPRRLAGLFQGACFQILVTMPLEKRWLTRDRSSIIAIGPSVLAKVAEI